MGSVWAWLGDEAVWTIPLGAFLIVSGVAFAIERKCSRKQSAKEEGSITASLIKSPQTGGTGAVPAGMSIADAPARKPKAASANGTTVQQQDPRAQAEKEEREHWEERLVEVRTGYLQRTRDSAKSWRDVFTALSAVGAGAVGVAAGSAGLGTYRGDKTLVYWVVSVALAASLNASLYTGWAAAGTPRSWSAQGTADQLRVAELEHAARSQQRLRLGMAAGGLAVLGAALIALVALGSALQV